MTKYSDYIVFIENGIRRIDILLTDTTYMVTQFLSHHDIPSPRTLTSDAQYLQYELPRAYEKGDADPGYWETVWEHYQEWERIACDVLASNGYMLESNYDVTGIYEMGDDE